jgi:hypothetical protein
MNTKYNFNKYGVYPTYSKYDDMNIEEINYKGKKILDIKPLENFRCGNLNDKLSLQKITNDKNNLQIKVLDQPITGQKYFDKYFNYPLIPEKQPNNAIEKWEISQPISFSQQEISNQSYNEFPVNNINIYDKLIDKYDNPYIYKNSFFNQNDARSNKYNYSDDYIKHKKETNQFVPK